MEPGRSVTYTVVGRAANRDSASPTCHTGPVTKRLRFAFATHSVFAGGAELALVDLVRLLVERGHEVLVVAPTEGPLIARLEVVGTRPVVAPLRWWAGVTPRRPGRRAVTAAALAMHSRRLRSLLATYRPDLAVTNTIATPALAIAAKGLRIPHLWLLHEYALPEQGLYLDLPRATTYRIAGALSAFLLAASGNLAREVTALGGHGCGVLYASVPPTDGALPRTAANEPPYQLLGLGHVTPAKRQEEVVRALAVLRNSGFDCRLVLVGRQDRSYVTELRRLARGLEVGDYVMFEGETQSPGPWLASSHLLVSASRYEACPRVVVEALKSYLPVVACDSAGNGELLAEGRGWLYAPGDAGGLARAVVAAVTSQASARAAQWAHRVFSDESYAETFLGWARRAIT